PDPRAPAAPPPPRLPPPSGGGRPPGGLPRQPAPTPPAPARRPRRRRRGPVLLVVAVLLVALTAYAGWWLGIGRYTSAPGIENLPVKAAQAKLTAAGLDLRITDRTYSETVAAG